MPETTALATRQDSALATQESRGFLFVESFDQAIKVADYIHKSQLVPDAYRGKPADIVIAMQYGMELGLAPLQALQSVAVINGKPSIYGDAVPAIVVGLPDCEDIIEEEPQGEEAEKWVATCTVKRRGKTPKVRSFSWQDAKRAGLTGKKGPWQDYPKRMLLMRARGFAIRDAFPDRMKGMILAEEAMDYPEPEPTPSEPRRVGESSTPAAAAAKAASAPEASTKGNAPAGPPSAGQRAAPAKEAPASTSSPSAPPAAASNGQTLLTWPNAKITGTSMIVDPKFGNIYEIVTSKGTARTKDEALYKEAASCEGTDHLFTLTYVVGRHNDKAVNVLRSITLEEKDDPTPNNEDGFQLQGGGES